MRVRAKRQSVRSAVAKGNGANGTWGGRQLAAALARQGVEVSEHTKQLEAVAERLKQLPQEAGDELCRELHLQAHWTVRRMAFTNPLLDFDQLLVVKRRGNLGLPQNWQSNCVLPTTGFDDEIGVLSPVDTSGKLTTFYRPAGPHFVGDVDLHFDADRLLFSSVGEHNKWHLFEINADGTGLRQLTFPLPDMLTRLFQIISDGFGYPVEIEFAATLAHGTRRARLGFLQLRPLATSREDLERLDLTMVLRSRLPSMFCGSWWACRRIWFP